MATTERYAKPKGASDLPSWFKEVRAGSNFMPSKIKPVSYNYMAQMAVPSRKAVYGASGITSPSNPLNAGPRTSITPMLRTDMGTYYAPTEKVASSIQKNNTIIQSIKSLGGEVKDRAGSMLHILGDIFSRPQYAVMNMYKENLNYWTKGENSLGGSRVTGQEHAIGAAATFSPFGVVANLVRGRGDDMLKAGWQGLSGKEKTQSLDILKQQTPGFVANHPTLSRNLSIGGDLLLDPLNFFGVVTAPGSVARAVGSAGLRIGGRKEAALKLWDETFFSPVGRQASLNTMRRDIIQGDVNKLNRKVNKIQKDAARKRPKMDDVARQAKVDELTTAISTKLTEDLKGADLAWRIVKKSVPNLGMGTVARLSTAASTSKTALAGAKTLKEAHDIATAATVADLVKEDRWAATYAAFQDTKTDIKYTHGGRQYVVPLSKAKDMNEWMEMIVREGAPLAAYAEANTKAARSRKGRNLIVESRAKNFLNALNEEFDSSVRLGLDPDTFNLYKGAGVAAQAAAKAPTVPEEVAKDPRYHVVDEGILDEGVTYDELKKAAKDAWYSSGEKGYKPTKASVIIKYDDGTYRRVSLQALKRRTENVNSRRAAKLDAEVKVANRTSQEKAVDAITGVSDKAARRRAQSVDSTIRLAEKRQAVIDTANAAKVTGAVKSAAAEAVATDAGATQVAGALQAVLNKMDDLTDGERAALENILNDATKSPSERVSEVLRSDLIDDETALESIEELFQMTIKDDTIFAATRGTGSGLEAIPQLFNSILADRWAARVTVGEEAASNITFDGIARQIEHLSKGMKQDPNYLRDVHAEIGLMTLDAYRYAVEYAVKMDELRDPEKLFAVINGEMDNFLNMATAETKTQVMQLLYNLTGMRLPENFVPTHAQIDAVSDFKFKDLKGAEYDNQQRIWQSLGTAMQEWAFKLFPDIPKDRYTTAAGVNAGTGYDVSKLADEVTKRAAKHKPFEAPKKTWTPKDRAAEKASVLRAKIEGLKGEILKAGDGTLNGNVGAVNRYDFLDFIMHDASILKSQRTTLTVTKTPAGVVNRIQAGRLSALDSFTFVSDEAKAGLKAVEDLKKLANSADSIVAEAARTELADLFVKNGGLEYLDEVRMPSSEQLADMDFSGPLKRLGVHARLKEEAILKQEQGSKFGYKFRADLMDHLWGGSTLVHEWQKAVQTKILKDVYITGMTHEQSAKKLEENLKDVFFNHNRIKKMLYPVMRNADITPRSVETGEKLGDTVRGPKATVPDMEGNTWSRSATLQKTWGGNEVTAKRNSPQVVTREEAAIALPDGVDPSNLNMVTFKGASSATPQQAREALAKALEQNDEILVQLFPPKLAHRDLRWVAIKDKATGKTIGYGTSYKGLVGKGNNSSNKVYMLHTNKVTNLGAGSFKTKLDEGLKGVANKERHDPQIPAKDYAPSPVLRGVEEMPPAKKVIPGEEKRLPYRVDSPEVSKTADLMEADKAHAAAELDAQAAVMDYAQTLKSTDAKIAPEGAPGPDPDSPVDSANVGDGMDIDFDELERSAIVDYVRKTYATANPKEVAQHLRAMSISMSVDIMEAQARLQTSAADLSFKHQRKMRFAGIPLMNVTGPANATHMLAGATALDVERAGAFKFWRDRFNRIPELERAEPTGYQKMMTKATRQSQVLEGSLDRIRMGVVNASSMERKHLIREMNKTYVQGINKGEFTNTNLANMTPRQRADYLSAAFFDKNLGVTPDRLNEFDNVAGDNPAKLIEARFQAIADAVFTGLEGTNLRDQVNSFNRYLTKKYKLSGIQLEAIARAGINDKHVPYTREWFVAVGRNPGLKNPYSNLSEGNIAELHYALEDARLKMRAGSELHKGVFEEFTFLMDPELANYHNRVLSPQTLDSKGNPMRGKYIPINELYKYNIDSKYIPSEYFRGDRYIPEDMVPDIKLMFEYMEGVSDLNDTLTVGFINKVLNYFKASVTIYKIPTYPVKNTMSDLFMGLMDGLTNPRYYRDAAEIVANNHAAMKRISLDEYSQILDQNFVNSSLARAAHDPASVKQVDDLSPNLRARLSLMLEGGEAKLNDTQIMHLYDELGLGQNRVVGEFNESVAAVRKSKVGKSAGKMHDMVKDLNDVREDWARVAHFVYALEREAPFGGSLDDVARRAADRVMKYHFDYGDVSLWERGQVAKHIPFYKWIKNVIPFTLTAMVTTPRYLNIEQAIGQVAGQTMNDDPNDVGYKDFVLPEYIDRENSVPIGWFMNNAGNKFNQYMVMGLPLSETISKTISPTIDPWISGEFDSFATQFEEAGKGALTTALSTTTPIHKGVMQAAFGQTLWPTGAAPEKPEESWYKTMAAVIPGFPALTDIEKNITPDEKLAGYTGMNPLAKVLDSVGAINVYNNTEKAQIGSLMKTEDRHAATLKARRAVIAKRVLEKYPHLTPEQADQVVVEYIKQERG